MVQRGRVLVFRHPHAASGVQLPKGTIESGESPAGAAVRELAEESGLRLSVSPQLIAEMKLTCSTTTAFPYKAPKQQSWSIFRFDPIESLPERWSHTATGSLAEDGLIFEYFWHPLAKSFAATYPNSDIRFATVIDAFLTKL